MSDMRNSSLRQFKCPFLFPSDDVSGAKFLSEELSLFHNPHSINFGFDVFHAYAMRILMTMLTGYYFTYKIFLLKTFLTN